MTLPFGRDAHALPLFVMASVVIILAGITMTWRASDNLVRHHARMQAAAWAELLREFIPGLDGLLATGELSEETRQALWVAARAGGIRHFHVLDSMGREVFAYDHADQSGTRPAAQPSTDHGDAAERRSHGPGGEWPMHPHRHSFPGPPAVHGPVPEHSHLTEVAPLSQGIQVDMIAREVAGDEAIYAFIHVPLLGDQSPTGALLLGLDMTHMVLLHRRTFGHVILGLTVLVVLAAGIAGMMLWRRIQERQRAEAHIRHLAQHDALTGLPNRALFRDRLDMALAAARRTDAGVAVLCLDLDRFKDINDTLGHPAGDALLEIVAERLTRCVRETDTVVRLGGDEFAIIQVGLQQPGGAVALAQRVLADLAAPCDIGGQEVLTGTSIGIALSPSDGDDPDRLLKSADIALYRAKADRRGTLHFYEKEMDARLQARRELEADLRRALAQGELDVHYQPQVELQSGAITGFEALLRWHHPERGELSPEEFILIAEESGLILPIGEWVLRQACREAATWPAPLKIAVNLSPAQFRHRDLTQLVQEALQESGLEPRRLELEITENLLIHDTEMALSLLRQLKAIGVRVSMDDFGTGYSSLSYLQRFPFDRIKIDQSFVRELAACSDASAIVRAVISLGRSLGMATTAEGVESTEQLAYLRAEGCPEAQGFYFSRPMPAAEVALLLAGQRMGDGYEAAPAPAVHAG